MFVLIKGNRHVIDKQMKPGKAAGPDGPAAEPSSVLELCLIILLL